MQKIVYDKTTGAVNQVFSYEGDLDFAISVAGMDCRPISISDPARWQDLCAHPENYRVRLQADGSPLVEAIAQDKHNHYNTVNSGDSL